MTAMRYDNVELPAVGLPRAMDRLRTSTFLGRDPDNVVTAVVDGDGIVDSITFANTAAARRPQVVAAAVLAAIADAQGRAIDALISLTMARDSTVTNEPTTVDGIVGGPVDNSHGGSR